MKREVWADCWTTNANVKSYMIVEITLTRCGLQNFRVLYCSEPLEGLLELLL